MKFIFPILLGFYCAFWNASVNAEPVVLLRCTVVVVDQSSNREKRVAEIIEVEIEGEQRLWISIHGRNLNRSLSAPDNAIGSKIDAPVRNLSTADVWEVSEYRVHGKTAEQADFRIDRRTGSFQYEEYGVRPNGALAQLDANGTCVKQSRERKF